MPLPTERTRSPRVQVAQRARPRPPAVPPQHPGAPPSPTPRSSGGSTGDGSGPAAVAGPGRGGAAPPGRSAAPAPFAAGYARAGGAGGWPEACFAPRGLFCTPVLLFTPGFVLQSGFVLHPGSCFARPFVCPRPVLLCAPGVALRAHGCPFAFAPRPPALHPGGSCRAGFCTPQMQTVFSPFPSAPSGSPPAAEPPSWLWVGSTGRGC